MKKLTFYTDGGCQPNPGNGTWAFVCLDPRTEKSGHEPNTTNNRMELMGVLEAIRFGLENKAEEIVIHSDSTYTVNAFNTWMHKWATKGWKGKKNIDIFQELFRLKKTPNIKIILVWVRGHDGNEYNELCDQIVRHKYEREFGGLMAH